jgi:hypothetical protein
MESERVKRKLNVAIIACDTRQLSVGAMRVGPNVWGDELGRVSQLDVLGIELDQVILGTCLNHDPQG